jgi:hypothetical protein
MKKSPCPAVVRPVSGRGLAVLLTVLMAGCGGKAPQPEPSWAILAQSRREALLSISGHSRSDVWAVGADRGRGPLVLHYDGVGWQELATGQRGDLWAVHALEQGPVMMAGANATILLYEEGHFTRMRTPGLARYTVYGLWGSRADDVYAVGSASGRGGFVWHYDGTEWREVEVPIQDLNRASTGELPAFFGVWGDGSRDVYVVGDRGALLRSRGGGGFAQLPAGVERRVSVHGQGGTVAFAGGAGLGTLSELKASAEDLEPSQEHLSDVTPGDSPILLSVTLAPDGTGWATGERGALYRRTKQGVWQSVDHGLQLDVQALQGSWVDPQGGVWLVGGNVLSSSLSNGVLLQLGAQVPAVPPSLIPDTPAASCPEQQVDPMPSGSIARRWDEQILGAIRRDIPRPTVHARNLFHVSAAMWDAWAAYDATADGVFVREKLTAQDVAAARAEAISYAAYRVLLHRYAQATGGATTKACLDAFMRKLGYDTQDTGTEGASPRALGNRIGQALISFGMADGANEQEDYKDTTGFKASNPPLVVETPGVVVTNPSLWQPLNLAVSVTQNGIDTTAGVQGYIGAHWGRVTPFALVRPSSGELYLDPGPAPTFGPVLRDNAVEVLQKSSWLGSTEPVDISPGALGNNSLGANDGKGHPLNPTTGQPYASNVVKRGDFGRVLAEFWADGPKSETPPGHWNVLANQVADSPGFARKLFGTGAPVDALEWDVKVYLALNGAVHDAAIAAWEIKRAATTARPITLLRYMGTLGQSSNPEGLFYNSQGLPLAAGLIEPITAESSARGGRHAHLAAFVGQLAVHAWRGEPGDRAHEASGSGWILASEWMPYQLRTFVTPAFPGFISGHSTFSRASAEVLAALTGSAYFPGGLGQYVAAPGTTLTFEQGPSTEVRLQWATYFDAADQAGQSRLWGGIHVEPDDFIGRKLGRQAGLGALEHARHFFDGSAVP